MFDMWSSVTSKLEAQTQIQTNIQHTQLQNSSSGSIKGKKASRRPWIINWLLTIIASACYKVNEPWAEEGFVQNIK